MRRRHSLTKRAEQLKLEIPSEGPLLKKGSHRGLDRTREQRTEKTKDSRSFDHAQHIGPAILPLREVIYSLDQGWSPQCERTPSLNNETWGVIKTSAVAPLQYIDFENKELPKTLVPRPELELQAGDILITRAGPRKRVGVVCLVRTTRPRLMLCDKVYRLKANTTIAIPEYIELMLNAPQIIGEFDQIKTGISCTQTN